MQTNTKRSPRPVLFTFAGLNFPHTLAVLAKGTPGSRLTANAYNNSCGPVYNPGNPDGKPTGHGTYLEVHTASGLRWTEATEVRGTSFSHDGWFTDDDGVGETMRGIVLRLNSGRGFLIGWTMGVGMATDIDTQTIYDSELDAAYAADDMARIAAEKECDYQRDQARIAAEEEEAEEQAEEQAAAAMAEAWEPLFQAQTADTIERLQKPGARVDQYRQFADALATLRELSDSVGDLDHDNYLLTLDRADALLRASESDYLKLEQDAALLARLLEASQDDCNKLRAKPLPVLGFDGFGLNDLADAFRSRVFTLATEYKPGHPKADQGAAFLSTLEASGLVTRNY